MTDSRRVRSAAALIAALLAGALLVACARPDPPLPLTAEGGPALIRDTSLVLTMDPEVGQGSLGLVEDGDVLLDGDPHRRGRAGPSSRQRRSAGDRGARQDRHARFVDLHTHLWQSLIRGCGIDAELNGWLVACVLPLFGSPVSDADAYAGARLSSLNVISTGVTTVADFSHAFTADFARGNLRALTDSRPLRLRLLRRWRPRGPR